MDTWKLSESYAYNGRMIRYGKMGEGPPMVLVHGTPWSSFNLRHLIRKLSENYTVYFYDLLGYGQSITAQGDVSLGVQNEVLTRLLEHWGSAFFQHVKQHEAAFTGLPDYIHESIVRSYVKTAANQPMEERILQRIVTPWTGEPGQAAFYRQMAQADSKYTDEVEPLYPTITTPTLILWGREDHWIPAERGEALQRSIPQSSLRIIENTGHLVIEERPDQLIEEILAFSQSA